ncbi:class I glutamine amidotransferase-like protein [Aspergillus pseudotamarii]|uniref:Class I glutamine amidotransferase-like protein n=1 Tax=Aspergillus pseudotamarii TaxID=132259 RepID=A0A5N6T9W2_ASPPS|nr:class I glutamine amidotransferase-like protein [Aspergillus pseudotamarii]KAE8143158.1 class I glutamine amidotransferase-like protein [Aspergillus pseudotamarii]
MAPKVLVVLTSQAQIPGRDHATGWFLPEFAHPWEVLHEKVELTIASPKGGEAPLDPSSIKMFESDPVSTKFLNEQQSLWKNTHKLADFLPRVSEFDAIFYVGGHGPMFDLHYDETSLALIQAFAAAGKPVSAVCHGPTVFVKATTKSGQPLLANSTVTAFTNVEEDQAQLTALMPYLVEDEMNKIPGCKFVKADQPWGEKVVVSKTSDGATLITGQNPASATGTTLTAMIPPHFYGPPIWGIDRDGPGTKLAKRLAAAKGVAALQNVCCFIASAHMKRYARDEADRPALAGLTVAAQGSQDGYDRDLFPHWISQGHSCDTREVVLARDGEDVEKNDSCSPTSGTWYSPYDGKTWTDKSDLDIDHVVPLSNAWKSGASDWTTDQRQAFANDLENPQLLAVTNSVNREKSDDGPEDWKPPLTSYYCTYAKMWVRVKSVYNLTITQDEKGALVDMLDSC